MHPRPVAPTEGVLKQGEASPWAEVWRRGVVTACLGWLLALDTMGGRTARIPGKRSRGGPQGLHHPPHRRGATGHRWTAGRVDLEHRTVERRLHPAQPDEGKPPAQATRFKVLYDNDALFFAFDLEDVPSEVSELLGRRDSFPGDWIEVNIDSYFDHRTAFSFTLSVSGSRGDEFISNDGSNWDSNWDPVWSGAATLDQDGWTAEMRIPLSQLRFSKASEQIWGLQVTRRVFRSEERSNWQRIPKDVTGWVSQFGELHGLLDLEPKRRIELMPYAVASSESLAGEAGDPFRDGSSSDFDGGIDGKIGLSNNLTLDFTINPDFGQVEADPSEVNLTAFETFFSERRPFFIEGSDIFELRIAPAITGGPSPPTACSTRGASAGPPCCRRTCRPAASPTRRKTAPSSAPSSSAAKPPTDSPSDSWEASPTKRPPPSTWTANAVSRWWSL